MIFSGNRGLLSGVEMTPAVQVALRYLDSFRLTRLASYLPLLLVVGATVQHPRRNQLEIVAQLLEIASQGGATKTSLVYKGNLNFKLAQRYLDELESKGMIVRLEGGMGTTYECTERGREFLRSISQVLDLMSENQNFHSAAPVQAF